MALITPATVAAVLPLTTVFTPSPSCLGEVYQYNRTYTFPGDTVATFPWDYLGSASSPSSTQCFPPGWDSTSQFFSPGLCPSGYTVNSTTLNIIGSITETAGMCCPTGYARGSDTIDLWAESLWSLVPCTKYDANIPVTTVYGPGSSVIGINTQLLINAYAVNIRWQSTDFQNVTSKTSSLTNLLASSTNTAISSPSGANVTTSAHSGPVAPSISTDAKAGIAIGCVFAALILLSSGWFFISRRRRAHAKALLGASGNKDERYAGYGIGYWKSELHSTPAVSLLGGGEIVEADGAVRQKRFHELESSDIRDN